jgi:GTP-binding protein HflX
VLAAVLLPDTRADLQNPLGELQSLAEAAGVSVADGLIQKRTSFAPSLAIGKGKLAELKEKVEAAGAEVVIFDNDLTPRQIRGLEEALGLKVIDRSELILDIFALRAKTREAQLQVELAQLEYTSPRLRGMWKHLERIAGAGGGTGAGVVGGVGTRGPGERQIEIDRRIVKDRISHLKREIEEIDRRKQREVRSRSDQFTVSLVGYTNAGKSTLMNKLTGAGRYAADQLFATLDTKTVRWDFGDGRSVLLSDTVGFIRDLPHKLVASFRATLEEAIHADLLLHVVDASSTFAWQQMDAVEEVLRSLDCDEIPRLTLLNKIDIANDAALVEMLAGHRKDVLEISAVTGRGLDELASHVLLKMESDFAHVTLLVPHAEGKLMSELGRVAQVRSRRFLDDGVELEVSIHHDQLRQLLGRYSSLVLVSGDLAEPPEAPGSP